MPGQIPTGRREADQLLLLLLRENDCSIPKGISSVGQLSSDLVIKAVGSLVTGIDGSSPLPESESTRGLHPADRHRACLAVASRVREAGYPEPLLAYHLLYPAEGSTRQLLLYLLNMLPPDGARPLPPPASSSGSEILPQSGAAEIQGNNLLSSDLAEGEGIKEKVQSPGASGEAVKKGTVVEDDGKSKGGKERDVTPVQEPGESANIVGVEEDALDSTTQLIVDEQDEGKGTLKSWGGVEGGEKRKGDEQGASIEPSGVGSPTVVDEHMRVVSSSLVEPGSAKSGVRYSAGQQPYASEEGGIFVSETEVPDEIPGPVETATEGNGWMQQHEVEEEENVLYDVFGGHARLQGGVGGGKETVASGADASSIEEVETTKGFEERGTVLPKRTVHEVGPWADQDSIAPTLGKDRPNGDDIVGGDEDPRAPSLSTVGEERVDETSTESDSAETSPDEAETEEIAEEGCDAAEAEGAARGVERIEPEKCQSMGGDAVRLIEDMKEGLDAPGGVMSEAIDLLAESVGLRENAVGEKEAAREEDITFLQFEVEAHELELKRLLREEETASKAANQLEEEARRLGALTEERETHCRYAAKALELLPNAADETSRLQREIAATELRMHAAQKAFAKIKKPLEERVRVHREELARRKARCRDLLSEIRSTYDESEQLSYQESLLKAAVRDMDSWERRKRGEVIIGFEEGGEESSGNDWGKGVMEEDEDNQRRRKAGALLRADIDACITNLCDEALTQKQEIAISMSEVLDSRRETNAAWDLLGRSEALAEEKLFSASKEALLSNKDRARDLVQAYKRLHEMDDVFSKLVETVPEVTKREEECHSLEDEAARIVSHQGGPSLMQLLMRDLKRVRSDAFDLERRLDEVLEEQRLQQESRQEAERLEQERKAAAEEQASSEDMEEGVWEEGRDDATSSQEVDIPGAAAAEGRQEEEEYEPKGFDGERRFEESGAMGFDHDGFEKPMDDEVDFVGDDEEENVWK